MTRERLIWRPNAISLDAWEAMSREDQIAWWKAQEEQEPPEPKRHMKVAISMYKKGMITLLEFPGFAYKLAAPDEIDEFMRLCPADLLATLKESLKSYGDDETAWPRFFGNACYAPWVTPEEIEESRRQEQERIWEGVRLLKQYVAKC